MSILYEILIATLFSALLSAKAEVKQIELVKTDQICAISMVNCETGENL